MIRDTRGQSIGLSHLFLSLTVGAAVYWIVDTVTSPLLEGARAETSNATANQATQWFGQAVGLMPAMMLVVAFFGTIVLSIYQQEMM